MGGENSSFAHNSLHLKITSGFAIRVVGDTVHTQYRCPSPGSGMYFLCVWCEGGGMQEPGAPFHTTLLTDERHDTAAPIWCTFTGLDSAVVYQN